MDMAPLLEAIRTAESKQDKEKALDDLLNEFLDPKHEEETTCMSETVVKKGLLDDLLVILQDDNYTTKVARILAEVAKAESVRDPCVEKGFIPIFLKVLDTSDDIEGMTQACRALGNMCYDNDEARKEVDENSGIKVLLNLLKSLMSLKETEKLRTIACGFLLNVTNTNDTLQLRAIELGALDVMGDYLKMYEAEEGLCNMVLVTVASLTDSEICKERLSTSSLCSSMVNFLRSVNIDLFYESVLEILLAWAEWDEIKDVLAETDLCKLLIQMAQVDIHNSEYSEDQQQRVKMASDLLILLLTGEKSMEILFDNGKGEIFTESLKWLESKEEHLQLSGALAVGNFARSDDHCRLLMEKGVAKKLLSILKPVYGETKHTLEHAALSALRNLAIPASNKAALIKEGVIDAVLVLVDSEMLAVTFKMLGVLRMLVDGQEEAAIRLGHDKEFVIRLVEWSACEEHPGVKGESTRLLAWIIKNCRTEESMRNVIRADGIPHLVTMATSEHIVMQNESLVSLTLIASTVLADAALALKEADLAETLLNLMKDDETLPEILCNALTLTKTICTAASSESDQSISCRFLACTGLISYIGTNLREELVNSGIADVIKKLANHEDSKVREAAQSVIMYIEEVQPVER